MKSSQKGLGAVMIIMLLLVLDQVLKIWIKTHMQLHESIEITSWFYIYFTENPGMAFGIEIIGKLFLTLFRIIVVIFFAYYLYKIIRDNYKFGYIACIALIFAGAIGNIVDSVFYGVLFDHSAGQVATFMPEGGGYADWLHGKVVDMFYFPLIDTVLPEWIPFWGGQDFIFFRPIFNLADSTICVGVFILFICYRHTLSKSLSKEEENGEEEKEKHAKKTV
ncbi:MAG: lipoprotein signal peptidase [Tannerellaceae bacterium]|jgi:signal peptidase II|nr:lipoprotein signal peptidase [Tannerellaceae bacterium]